MEALTGKFARIIYHGEDWAEHYADKFRARRAVMLHALSKGWDLDTCEFVFLDPSHPGGNLWLTGEDGRRLRETEALKRLTRDYEAASTYKRANPGYKTAQDARAQISSLKKLAAAWPPRSRMDRDVLRYVHGQAYWVGCDRINVSARDASLGAGVSLATAITSLGRLVKAGWLEVAKKGSGSKAALYKLRKPVLSGCPRSEHITPTPGESYMFENGTPTEPDHECWLHLGKVAMDLHSILDGKPVSVREAARRADGHKSTVHRVLPVMAEYGLARKTESGWVRGPCDPDQVVQNYGWTGVNSKRVTRALQYKQDRDNYRTLGRDAALNDPRAREAARAPVRLRQARAKASSLSSPGKAPVWQPAPGSKVLEDVCA